MPMPSKREYPPARGLAPVATAAIAAAANLLTSGTSARAGANDWTLAVLPDTQFYSESDPTTFNVQTQWVVDNKAAQNIQFTVQLGDIVNHAYDASQWPRAVAAMNKLNGVM